VTYQLAVAGTAERQLQRLPDRVAAAVVEFLVGPLVEDPERVGKPLAPPFEGLHSARRGNYRVIYRVEEKTVVVLRVAHRSHVYRP
jgi:mRNA interferase RelE/StbE